VKKEDFLQSIYDRLESGMKILTPNRQTDILEIRESGDIVYLVANAYKKVLSRQELELVYDHLEQGAVKTSVLRDIVTPSRTCNVSTIKWILGHLNLARENDNRSWEKTWQ
jgi:hypothetical protein